MSNPETVNVAVNGFGRIGIPFTQIALEREGMNLQAINSAQVNPLDRAHNVAVSIEFDSTHGWFRDENYVIPTREGEESGSIVVDEREIAVYGFRNLQTTPWGDHGKDVVVVESSGQYKNREEIQGHFDGGAKLVVFSSPIKDPRVTTIVRGVNDTEETYASVKDAVAVSSCSTNCISPILKVLGDHFSPTNKFLFADADIPHAVTNSQKPLGGVGDSTVKRRSSNAMIPASTGSTKEVPRLLDDFEMDYFDAMSLRIPIPVGSLAILRAGFEGHINEEDVRNVLKEASQTTHKGVIWASPRGVLSDKVIGLPYSSVIDPREVKVRRAGGQSHIKIYAWFDNEWGYSNRVADIVQELGRQVLSR